MRVFWFVLASAVLFSPAQSAPAQLPGPSPVKKEANGKSVGVALVKEGAGVKDKIKELLKQRLAVAAEAYKLRLERFKGTNGLAVEIFQACKSLAQARLDLCETKEERIKACEQNLKEAEHFENITQNFAKAGLGTQADALMAKVLTLEAKIALEKAKLEK